ncbi:YeeE/YedE family protein [Thalassobaculum sp.]|uniref:YeeE/YedE family protein n=1 Tax=Thalassobaculum sp. TaxID=2022740 RepID=UPI0032EB1CEF
MTSLTIGAAATALAGGALIGLSAVVLLLGVGRIAGVSGVFGRILPPFDGRLPGWASGFLIGLIGIPVIIAALGAGFATLPPVGLPWIVVGGFFVGAGSTLGNGCTSGHGVCGLARLSPRSMAAVAVFLLVAMATVAAVSGIHQLGAS